MNHALAALVVCGYFVTTRTGNELSARNPLLSR
jgi:hypothetical protein